jgi:SAM-dependent methyltransferase
MDRFLVRQSILQAICSCHTHLRGRCLDVGCGNMPYKPLLLNAPFQITEVLGLDRAGDRCQQAPPDLVWINGTTIPLPDSSVDSALCTEVLEHCPDPQALLQEVHRVLRPGGNLVLTVPFLWPLHEVPHDWARYTPFALRQVLESAGFDVQELRSLGGYDRAFAQMMALWVRRRPMNRWLRVFLTLLLYPVWFCLRVNPESHTTDFSEGMMITGLMARAQRLIN